MRNKFLARCIIIATILLIGAVGYTARQEYFPSAKIDSLTATTATITTVNTTTVNATTGNITTGILTNLTATNGLIYEILATTYSKIKNVYFASTSASITSHSDVTQVGSMAWCAAQIGSAGGTIVLPPKNTTYTTNSNYAVPTNVTVILDRGAILDPAVGTVLTLPSFNYYANYQVFASSTNLILSTPYILPEWFGAVPNDSIDDTAAIQGSINNASIANIPVVNLGSGVYNFTKLWLSYNAVSNSGYAHSIASDRRGVILRGTGKITTRASTAAEYYGTVLISSDATGPAISAIGDYDSSGTVGNQYQIENMTIIADNTTNIISFTDTPNDSKLTNLYLRQDGAGDGVVIRTAYYYILNNLRIDGASAGSVVSPRTGVGLKVYNVAAVSSGGIVNTANITADGWQTGIQFGYEVLADAARMHSIRGSGIEARYCDLGFWFTSGAMQISLDTWHVENTTTGLFFNNNARLVTLSNGDVYDYTTAAIFGESSGAASGYKHIKLDTNFFSSATATTHFRIYSTSYTDGLEISNNSLVGDAGVVSTAFILDNVIQHSLNISRNEYTNIAYVTNYPQRVSSNKDELTNIEQVSSGAPKTTPWTLAQRSPNCLLPTLELVQMSGAYPFLKLTTDITPTTNTNAISTINGNDAATASLGMSAPKRKGTASNGWVFSRMLKVQVSTATTKDLTVTSITRSGTTATVTMPSVPFVNGNTVTISGAYPDIYNGAYVISGVSGTTFNYTMASDPGASASGTILANGYVEYWLPMYLIE